MLDSLSLKQPREELHNIQQMDVSTRLFCAMGLSLAEQSEVQDTEAIYLQPVQNSYIHLASYIAT